MDVAGRWDQRDYRTDGVAEVSEAYNDLKPTELKNPVRSITSLQVYISVNAT